MKLPRSHFSGTDCKGGRHKVDVGHGEVVRMCGLCFKKFNEGPGRAKAKKVPMWTPLSSIPIPPGFTEKDMEEELDREVAAETGNRPRKATRTTTEIVNDYQTVYRQCYRKDITVETIKGGWLGVVGPIYIKVRPSKLAKMADTLRKRL